jgi:hypothetical protein
MRAPGIIHDLWNQQSTLASEELAEHIAYRAFGAFNVKEMST